MVNKDEKLAILNPDGEIEIIEFFDYNCGHCKREAKVIKEFLKNRKDVKLILRPIPILGRASVYATQIGHAIMISEPDKYFKYYDSLMNNFGGDGDPIYEAIKDSGVNIEKLKNVLETNKDDISEMIKRDAELADRFGVQGTPAFVINGKLIPGTISLEELNSKIK